jgi:hypothetical protein
MAARAQSEDAPTGDRHAQSWQEIHSANIRTLESFVHLSSLEVVKGTFLLPSFLAQPPEQRARVD